ncbi:MAG TPA: hypothetical protein DCL66_01580 [Gammaproteobacteria bacterium]|nr:hypothetical protein [Gammaproteobacteria bacterium]
MAAKHLLFLSLLASVSASADCYLPGGTVADWYGKKFSLPCAPPRECGEVGLRFSINCLPKSSRRTDVKPEKIKVTVVSKQAWTGTKKFATATIERGGIVTLEGIVHGNINVKPGGALKVTGVVNGTVVNNGGYVEIAGLAHHVATNSGKTVVSGKVETVTSADGMKAEPLN